MDDTPAAVDDNDEGNDSDDDFQQDQLQLLSELLHMQVFSRLINIWIIFGNVIAISKVIKI